MFKIQTHSKLNLGYQILERRQDGIFNINSVQMKLPIGDIIEFEESNNLDIRIETKNNTDILLKTINKSITVFSNYYCIDNIRAKITINNRIPMHCGLGSRASLASALLRGLSVLSGKSFQFGDIESLGILIDEDVEFFMSEYNTALIQNGLTKKNLDLLNPFYTIVVIPQYEIDFLKLSTILNDFDFNDESLQFPEDLQSNMNNLTLSKEYFNLNYIEKLIFTIYPELKEVKDTLISMGAIYSVLNNKGCSIFGLFDDKNIFIKACDMLQKYRIYIYEPK